MGALSLPPPGDDDEGRRLSRGPERLSARDASGRDGDPIVIPDDLRGLEDEIRTVQAELGIDPRRWEPGWRGRRARLAARLGRRARPGPDQAAPSRATRPLLLGPIFAGILLLVAGLVALFPPTVSSSMRRAPAPPRLAAPVQPPGAVGGLLPDVLLESSSGVVAARSLRPAVLLLVPDGCACPGLVDQVMAQVTEFPGLDAALITTGRDPAARRLAADARVGSSRLTVLVDRDAVLAQTYRAPTTVPPGAPTVLLVAGDGVLTEPPTLFADAMRIESGLLPLVPRRA